MMEIGDDSDLTLEESKRNTDALVGQPEYAATETSSTDDEGEDGPEKQDQQTG